MPDSLRSSDELTGGPDNIEPTFKYLGAKLTGSSEGDLPEPATEAFALQQIRENAERPCAWGPSGPCENGRLPHVPSRWCRPCWCRWLLGMGSR